MRLPDRLGRFEGVTDLPLIIVASNAVVSLFEWVRPGLTPMLTLSPAAVWAGEFWRLLTFLFVPPPLSPLFLLFWLYILYIYADALETEWGSFRFTVYYLLGALATAAVGFFPAHGTIPNVYLNASLFLAFATLFPTFELLLFFVLPVQVRYLGYLTWAWLGWSFLTGGLLTRLAILAGLINYILLLGPDLRERLMLRWQTYRNRRRWKTR
ncbi:MAG TPA: hypothetical protein P5079_01360 [Elusimicrobiota bacterium]|nr:hypothetical protein [Elusimicrobiota bacterium]